MCVCVQCTVYIYVGEAEKVFSFWVEAEDNPFIERSPADPL